MTIATLTSPNLRNRNSYWRETWRHNGRRIVPQISLDPPPPPPSSCNKPLYRVLTCIVTVCVSSNKVTKYEESDMKFHWKFIEKHIKIHGEYNVPTLTTKKRQRLIQISSRTRSQSLKLVYSLWPSNNLSRTANYLFFFYFLFFLFFQPCGQ